MDVAIVWREREETHAVLEEKDWILFLPRREKIKLQLYVPYMYLKQTLFLPID